MTLALSLADDLDLDVDVDVDRRTQPAGLGDLVDAATDRIYPDLPYDDHRDGGSVAITSRYLGSILTLR